MGLFDDQLKTRLQYDREAVSRALGRLAAAVSGKSAPAAGGGAAEDAAREIFAWFRAAPPEPPGLMSDFSDRLDYMLGPTGILRRPVRLKGRWWRDAFGPMLAFTRDGGAVALLPRRFGGYGWLDHRDGRYHRAGRDDCGRLTGEAICFYRPLPPRELTRKDLARFLLKALDGGDLAVFLSAGLLAGLSGMAAPLAARAVTEAVLPVGRAEGLAPVAATAAGMLACAALMGLSRDLGADRITRKLRAAAENAAMGRLLGLPAQFFREQSAGELQNRMEALSRMCALLGGTVLTGAAGGAFSLVYLLLIRLTAPALFGPAAAILAAQLLMLAACAALQARTARERLDASAALNGLVYRLFTGIQKIKLAGAERRAFAKWAELYAGDAAPRYRPPLLLRLRPALAGLIALAGSLPLCFAAAKSGLSAAGYLAFSSAHGLLGGAALSLASAAGGLAELGPLAELAGPILRAVPEARGGKKRPARVSGGLELSNLSFRYSEDGPWILNHIDLKVRPGQYLAIVGKTGCGKSTLLRLLLGFETPTSGAVYYDNLDLQTLDPRALRQNIGAVLQTSGLFSGDIYSNIALCAPRLTLEGAWEAARMAGMEEEIRQMPMGMFTQLSEGGGGVSGGQRQRLMIARAIAPKPKILLFDEATSALDNIAQRAVSDALAALKCTRIVVAHRLSTIRQCDRVLVLDGGRIVEDGSYDELLAAGGVFADLARRQMPRPEGAR